MNSIWINWNSKEARQVGEILESKGWSVKRMGQASEKSGQVNFGDCDLFIPRAELGLMLTKASAAPVEAIPGRNIYLRVVSEKQSDGLNDYKDDYSSGSAAISCSTIDEITRVIEGVNLWYSSNSKDKGNGYGDHTDDDDDKLPWRWFTWRADGLADDDALFLAEKFKDIHQMMAELPKIKDTHHLLRFIWDFLHQDFYLE